MGIRSGRGELLVVVLPQSMVDVWCTRCRRVWLNECVVVGDGAVAGCLFRNGGEVSVTQRAARACCSTREVMLWLGVANGKLDMQPVVVARRDARRIGACLVLGRKLGIRLGRSGG
jgi:hypothetical protein